MRNYVNTNWHLYSIQVSASHRKHIFETMRAKGVGVQVNYMPANWHPVFSNQGSNFGMYPVAEAYYRNQISLPMHANLTELEQEYVSKTLISICDTLKY